MTQFASVPDLAAAVQRPIESGDATAALILETASAAIQSWTEQTIELVEDDEVRVDGRARAVLYLPERPVVSIESIVVRRLGSDDVELVAADDWDVELRTGRLTRLPAPTFWDWGTANLAVTYTHGYPIIPDAVRLVCLAVAARAWENPSAMQSLSTATTQLSFGKVNAFLGAGFYLTDQDKELLAAIGPFTDA